ncbi:hypothetical protein [Peribacillus sp. SCS-155]|uniref:hypothetical protein n=1 Tax=Peribacillus sedimenti TaxID=3115297 RepID=UPI0039058C5F
MFITNTGLTAMDPAKVKKINAKAPVRLIGKVTSDRKFKEETKKNGEPRQIRKMNLQVLQPLKLTDHTEGKTSIPVYYTYIPIWLSSEYVGAKFMDIAEGDVIEISLDEGKYGLEPVLSGDSVRHITYVKTRNEPIQEPFLHMIQRKTSEFIQKHSGEFVLICIFFVLAGVVLRTTKKYGYVQK